MSDSEQPTRGSAFSRPTVIVAMAVVAVVVVCIVVFVIAAVTRGHSAPGAATPHPSTTSVAGETTADRSVCGLGGFETHGTLTSAPSTKWSLVGLMAAPSNRVASGPGSVAGDGFRSCYAHTRAGALFAAANFLALDSDQAFQHEAFDKLLAAGPGRDADLAASGSQSSTGTRYQIAGFRLDSYSASRATVDLALNTTSGGLVSFPLSLVWESGDWKVATATDGGLLLAPAPLSDLGGYVPWAGA